MTRLAIIFASCGIIVACYSITAIISIYNDKHNQIIASN